MRYSEPIENFLDFLREAQQEYNIAVSGEQEANDRTQDILHTLELEDNKYHDCARLAVALREVRQERRMAKDKKQQLQPIIDWADANMKVIKNMEQLLGAVRKAEKSLEGRFYKPKTDAVEKALNGRLLD